MEVGFSGAVPVQEAEVTIEALDPESGEFVPVGSAVSDQAKSGASANTWYLWSSKLMVPEKYWTIQEPVDASRPHAATTARALLGTIPLGTFEEGEYTQGCIGTRLREGMWSVVRNCSESTTAKIYANCGLSGEEACPTHGDAPELLGERFTEGCIGGTAANGEPFVEGGRNTCVSCGRDTEKACVDQCLQGFLGVDGFCSLLAGKTGETCKAGTDTEPCVYERDTCESKKCETTLGGDGQGCYGSQQDQCIDDLNCVGDPGTCQATGAKDQACNPDDSCEEGLVCKGEGEDRTCQSGGPGQPCNADEPACDDEWYSCQKDSLCQPCGGAGDPECPPPADAACSVVVDGDEEHQLEACRGTCLFECWP